LVAIASLPRALAAETMAVGSSYADRLDLSATVVDGFGRRVASELAIATRWKIKLIHVHLANVHS
jgi:hypothetical protein